MYNTPTGQVRLHDCGNFYSIVWYRSLALEEQERVYVYRHHSGVSKVGHTHMQAQGILI